MSGFMGEYGTVVVESVAALAVMAAWGLLLKDGFVQLALMLMGGMM